MLTSPSKKEPERVSRKEKICYALGDAGASIAWRAVAAFLFIFYTDVVGLSPIAAGTLFMAVGVLDSVAHVMMGIVCDRTQTRDGRFRPWILWTAIPLAVVLSSVFTCPSGLGGTGRLVYASVTYALYVLVYAANAVPYGALLMVMTRDSQERTSIGACRAAGAFAGGMLIQGLLLHLVSHLGYSLSVYLLSIPLVVCFGVTFYGTRERVTPRVGQKMDLWLDSRNLLCNAPWLILIAIGLSFGVYNAIRQGVTVYYFTYCVHRELLVGGFFTALMCASIAGALVTAPLARRWGKRAVYMAAFALAGLVNACFTFCDPAQLALVFVLGIVGEFFAAFFPVLFVAMLGDVVDRSASRNGRRATGFIYSVTMAITKFSGGIAGCLIGAVLAAYGYQGTDPQTIAGVTPGIKLLMGAIPSAIAALAIGFLCLYPRK